MTQAEKEVPSSELCKKLKKVDLFKAKSIIKELHNLLY